MVTFKIQVLIRGLGTLSQHLYFQFHLVSNEDQIMVPRHFHWFMCLFAYITKSFVAIGAPFFCILVYAIMITGSTWNWRSHFLIHLIIKRKKRSKVIFIYICSCVIAGNYTTNEFKYISSNLLYTTDFIMIGVLNEDKSREALSSYKIIKCFFHWLILMGADFLIIQFC